MYKLQWLPKVGKKLTVNDPEYWGLASIVTDEMAEVALKMKVHKGMKLKEIIKATGKSAAYLEPLLKEMANVGLVEFNWENPEHEKQYMLSGQFSTKAYKEAARFGDCKVVASSKEQNFSRIPDLDPKEFRPDADYFHICMNNTIYGTVFHALPETGDAVANHTIPYFFTY